MTFNITLQVVGDITITWKLFWCCLLVIQSYQLFGAQSQVQCLSFTGFQHVEKKRAIINVNSGTC